MLKFFLDLIIKEELVDDRRKTSCKLNVITIALSGLKR